MWTALLCPTFPPLPVGVPQLPLACEISLFFSTVGVKFLPPVLSVNAPFLLTVGPLCFRPLDKFYLDFKACSAPYGICYVSFAVTYMCSEQSGRGFCVRSHRV